VFTIKRKKAKEKRRELLKRSDLRHKAMVPKYFGDKRNTAQAARPDRGAHNQVDRGVQHCSRISQSLYETKTGIREHSLEYDRSSSWDNEVCRFDTRIESVARGFQELLIS
jgi:hypothetical protein